MGVLGQDVYKLLSYDSSTSELVPALHPGMPNNSFRGFVHTQQTTQSFLVPLDTYVSYKYSNNIEPSLCHTHLYLKWVRMVLEVHNYWKRTLHLKSQARAYQSNLPPGLLYRKGFVRGLRPHVAVQCAGPQKEVRAWAFLISRKVTASTRPQFL